MGELSFRRRTGIQTANPPAAGSIRGGGLAAQAELVADPDGGPAAEVDLDHLRAAHRPAPAAGLVREAGDDLVGAAVEDLAGVGVGEPAVQAERRPAVGRAGELERL